MTPQRMVDENLDWLVLEEEEEAAPDLATASVGLAVLGGKGSGNFGHLGRKGKVGGSGGGGGATAQLTALLPGQVIKDSDPKLEALIRGGRLEALAGSAAKRVKSPYGTGWCHQNVASMYAPGKNEIMTGYYADKKEGVWRPHSWLMKGSTILETTDNRASHYAGVRLSAAESRRFVRSGGLL